MPLFEAVVNAIHSTDEAHEGNPEGRKVSIEIVRAPQAPMLDESLEYRRLAPLPPIHAFVVTDNGLGFTDDNLTSFETLDTDFKARLGCRGVGRLLWLKAFERAEIVSTYAGSDGKKWTRNFAFGPPRGTYDLTHEESSLEAPVSTSVRLEGLRSGTPTGLHVQPKR